LGFEVDVDAIGLKQGDEAWNGIVPEVPSFTEALGRTLSVRRRGDRSEVLEGGLELRPEAEDLVECMEAFELNLQGPPEAALARGAELSLAAELNGLELARARRQQVVGLHLEGIAELDEVSRTRHGLSFFILMDRLSTQGIP
jgi:hypothetical protein